MHILQQPYRELYDAFHERAMFCQLDGDLKASAPRLLTRISPQLIASPAIVRSGTSTWLAANAQVWQLHADGSLDLPIEAGIPASDMVVNAPFPRIVGATKAFTTTGCTDAPGCRAPAGPFRGYCYFQCQITTQSGYALKFMALYSTYASAPFTFESDSQPAIQSDGRDTLIAWFRGAQTLGGDVVVDRLRDVTDFDAELQRPQVIGTFAPDPPPTRPDIATDGERYFIVWQTRTSAGDHNITGAALDASGRVTPFTIAATPDDERKPSVIATRRGTFLIAYEKIHGTDRQLTSRSVTFDGRERVVR